MCSPGSQRPGREGVSQLHAFWLYQLQHGDRLRICFPCFKLLFLNFRESLESGDWEEEEDWDPEPAQPPWAGAGPSGWLGGDEPPQGGPADWDPDTLSSESEESEELGLTPTELTPQSAASLGLGPEHADWTQGLPWRFGGVPTCTHWPSAAVFPQSSLSEVLPPGEPMLLVLVATQEVDVSLADAWLLSLQAMSMVVSPAGTYLRHMAARWLRRTPELRWGLLLEPDDLYVLRLQSAPPGHDMSPWQLSLLELSPTGHGTLVVPAGTALLMRGFRILSYGPWNKAEGDACDAAFRPPAPHPEQGPGAAGTGSWEPLESLGPEGASLFPAPQPEAPGGWQGQAAVPPPQPQHEQLLVGDEQLLAGHEHEHLLVGHEQLLAGAGGSGLWWEDGAWPRD